VVGVQWHAEAMSSRETESRLFESFVEACSNEGGSSPAGADGDGAHGDTQRRSVA
jgi:hypothetical protein